MGRTEPLKVTIDAALINPDARGGVAYAILGLVHALGQLTEGPEEYVIVVSSQQQLQWLQPRIGANQRLMLKPQLPGRRGGELLKRALGPLRPVARYIRRRINEEQRQWPEIPLSDGFYESLGCDVIHFPHQVFVLCALPAIYNPHDLQHCHYPQFFTARTIAWRETIYLGGSHFAHTVVAASQWVKDDIIRHYRLDPEKVQVIPWAAPTQAFTEPSPESLHLVKRKYQLEQPFAVFPAVTWPHKNHLRLFDALAYLRDERGLIVQLVATGSRYEPFWPQIEKRLDALKLRSQVKFLGLVAEEDLRAIYRLSQFLVMPTLFESDSFPVYEAWLEGLPVACSDVCSLPEQALDAALLFDPTHVESIANAVARVATDAPLREDLRKRGYRRLTDFTWERTAKAYRAVYRRAAGHRLNEEDQWLLRWDWMRESQRKREARLH
jgi:glycosyltransferase involved in cell wall biosynthesis